MTHAKVLPLTAATKRPAVSKETKGPPAEREAEAKLAIERNTLFLSNLVYKLTIMGLKQRALWSIKTMRTDGIHLDYNPDTVLGWTQDELKFVLAHEAQHVLDLHPWRRGTRDPDGWNIACDKSVNYTLASAQVGTAPAGVVRGENGYPEALYQDPVQPPGGGGQGGAQGQEGDAGDEQGESEDGDDGQGSSGGGSGDRQDDQDQNGQNDQNDQNGGQGDGGGQSDDEAQGSGDGQPQGQPEGAGGGCGEVTDPTDDEGSPLTQSEFRESLEEKRQEIGRIMEATKRAGQLPAGMERHLNEMLETHIPWRTLLKDLLDRLARTDYSWKRPSRRYALRMPTTRGHGMVVMPALASETFGRVTILGDTSGSMGDRDVARIRAAANEILEVYAENGQTPEIDVLWFDTDVYPDLDIQEVKQLTARGGGGTSTAKAFAYLRERADEQDIRAAIVVTDGEIGGIGNDPGMPVLWILTEPNRTFRPPFGMVAWTIDE